MTTALQAPGHDPLWQEDCAAHPDDGLPRHGKTTTPGAFRALDEDDRDADPRRRLALAADPPLAGPPRARRGSPRRRHAEPGRPLARGEARPAGARHRDRLRRVLHPRAVRRRRHAPGSRVPGRGAPRARARAARAPRGSSRRLAPEPSPRALAARPQVRRPDDRPRLDRLRLLGAPLRDRRVRA